MTLPLRHSFLQMQIPLTNSPFKPPQFFPFHNPKQFSLQTHIPNSLKGSGYLSEITKAIDYEEQYRVAKSQVNRKGLDLEGYSIEGISIGGHETCIIIPEFKCAFDIGRCPTRAIHQNFVFITHAHLDHIVSSLIFGVFVHRHFLN
jgi:ribonuclease Z